MVPAVVLSALTLGYCHPIAYSLHMLSWGSLGVSGLEALVCFCSILLKFLGLWVVCSSQGWYGVWRGYENP